MRKEREKREAEKNKKRKKKKKRGLLARTIGSQAAPAREATFRVWPAGWRSGSRTEEVEGVGKVVG
jgi:hypothetical protein